MNRALVAAGLVLLAQGALLRATSSQEAYSKGTSSLEYQRGVELAPGAAQQFLVVDPAVWGHARADLGDVRLYSGGTEVPYLLQTGGGVTVHEQADCKILQPATVAGNTQFILDMTQTEIYNRVNLDLETKDFVARARIEGANDVHAREWALLGSSSLYDFTSENLGHNSTLQMPDSTFRYLRVTLEGPVKRGEVHGAKTGVGHEEASRWVTVAEHPAITQEGRNTVLRFNMPNSVPVERVHFDIDGAQGNFLRSVEVQSLDEDGRKKEQIERVERFVANGTITRIHMLRGGKQIDQEDANVFFFAREPGAVKIVVHNGDDRPLKIAGAQLQQLERRIYFQTPATQATLFYGNERVDAPSYDYAKLVQIDPGAGAARLLAETVNTAYQAPPDPRPWSERHPAAIWAALIAAIVVLGGVALRSLRSVAA
jgi:hypothetical protein